MFFFLLFLPFLGFLGGCFFGRFLGKYALFYCITNIFISCTISLLLLCFNFLRKSTLNFYLAPWFFCDNLYVSWEFYGDNLTFFMCFIVTFISLLVHIYSLEYMVNDPFIIRFFSFLSLFTFFMLILITASNFLQMFVGWEGVGLSSYLLINFWYTRLQANKAAIKAMLFNRFADMLLLLGFFGIFIIFETYDYTLIFSLAPFFCSSNLDFFFALDFICIFLFLGAMGKSAQLGFHNWLPDAMEGPTPVSALIHAATMVTAGVFLIVRCSYLFEYSSMALNFISVVGALTAFFGSTTGFFFHDIKRVIAFSTCSQLGYMILACGLSRFNIAFFHLVTHAFFKALLFLTAGAIIHSVVDEQDIRKIGSSNKYLPVIYSSFLVGSLNLMGFPFLSGFYSKDILLELAFVSYNFYGCFCYTFGVLSIFFTAAYSTRLWILVFVSEANYSRFDLKLLIENSNYIRYPLIILSLFSIFFGSFFFDHFCGFGSNFFGTSFFFERSIANFADIEFLNWDIKMIPLFITFFGFFSSFCFYILNLKKFFFFKKSKWFQYVYRFLLKKWYSDRLVNHIFSLYFIHFCSAYSYISLDRGFLEILGPTLMQKVTKSLIL